MLMTLLGMNFFAGIVLGLGKDVSQSGEKFIYRIYYM